MNSELNDLQMSNLYITVRDSMRRRIINSIDSAWSKLSRGKRPSEILVDKCVLYEALKSFFLKWYLRVDNLSTSDK